MSEAQSRRSVARDNDGAIAKPGRPRRAMRIVGVLLLVLAGLLAWYLAILYIGWQSGQTILEERREIDLVEQIGRQVELAGQDIEQDNFELALRRLTWVLQRDPANEDARTLYQTAEDSLNALFTPAPTLEVRPSPTPEVVQPTPTVAPIEDHEDEFARIQQLVESEGWEEAVSALVRFQRQFPEYRRLATDALLYDAYIGLGLQLVKGDQVELGLFYLDQAEHLGDLPQPVDDYRTWAELYLQGIAFYEVNWEAAIYYFRDLCLAAPFYQSSCQRLRQALVSRGDQFAAALDWCPARPLYQEASQYGRSQQLAEKLDQAAEGCLLATPTPAAIDVEAGPITSTFPITAPFEIPPLSTIMPPSR